MIDLLLLLSLDMVLFLAVCAAWFLGTACWRLLTRSSNRRRKCASPYASLNQESDARDQTMMRVLAVLCAVVACAAIAQGRPPAAAAAAALADLRSQPAGRRHTLRYLIAASDQEAVAISYVLNAVSRSRLIVRPEVIDSSQQAVGDEEGQRPFAGHLSPTLLRIDLTDYANPREPGTLAELQSAWEKLVEIDPYFHVQTQVAVAVGNKHQAAGNKGRQAPGVSPVTNAAIKIVTVDGGWIPANVSRDLKLATASAGPVLRGDFFVAHASQAPHYYNFAGVPSTEDGLLKRLGIDRAQIDKLSADTAANL